MKGTRILRCLLLTLLLGEPRPALAQEPPAVSAGVPVFVDALPTLPPVQERIREITQRIQEAVVYPPRARERGTHGISRIQFRVGHYGRAAEIQLVKSSGSALLDKAATQGARDARQLPFVYGRLLVPIRFELERTSPP